ncbi:MAG: efflux RND transporter periplasmic adaptor subunit [Parafilimonas sp.]
MYKYILYFLLIVMASCSSQTKQEKKTASTQVTDPYEFAPVKKAGVESVIKLPAKLAAYEEVSIFPKVNGYVKDVLVDIGSQVKKGQLLMILEAPEIEQATTQAKEKYMQSLSAYALSKERYRRLQVAAKTQGAISPFDLSSAKSSMDADSMLCNAEKTSWMMQQTMQDYLRVTAPFNGVITQRNVHPGALVSAVEKTTPMLELKNISHLRLQMDAPETIASALSNKGSISFTTSSTDGTLIKAVISRRSMNVESALRSERIEADVNNKDLSLAPGMYAEVQLESDGNANAFKVPKSAVLTTTEGKYVFTGTNEKDLKKISVSTGNQSVESVEVCGALQEGEKVVTNPDDEMLDTM